MNLLNQTRLAKRVSALVGVAGTLSLLGLPALAQVNSNEVQNNQSQTGQTAVQCPDASGMGGSINNSSASQINSDSSQSSDDVASQGVNSSSTTNSSSMIGQVNSSSATNSSNMMGNTPAVTAGQEASSNLDAANSSRMNGSSSMNNSSMSANMSNNMYGQQSSRYMIDGQFSGRNPSAAFAFRSNGPAGTSGREAISNLQAMSRNDRGSMQGAMQSSTMTPSYTSSSTQTQTNQSVASLPVECVPNSTNNQSAPAR